MQCRSAKMLRPSFAGSKEPLRVPGMLYLRSCLDLNRREIGLLSNGMQLEWLERCSDAAHLFATRAEEFSAFSYSISNRRMIFELPKPEKFSISLACFDSIFMVNSPPVPSKTLIWPIRFIGHLIC